MSLILCSILGNLQLETQSYNIFITSPNSKNISEECRQAKNSWFERKEKLWSLFALAGTRNSRADIKMISISCVYSFYRKRKKKVCSHKQYPFFVNGKKKSVQSCAYIALFPKWRLYIAQIWSHRLIKLESQPSLRSFNKTSILSK